jgi:hypothetical protein
MRMAAVAATGIAVLASVLATFAHIAHNALRVAPSTWLVEIPHCRALQLSRCVHHRLPVRMGKQFVDGEII